MTDEAEIGVENRAIVLRPIRRTLRDGWAEASRAVRPTALGGVLATLQAMFAP
ncbi:MAG: hypothetical protein ABJB17_10705 [Burkholderiales bacterium]